MKMSEDMAARLHRMMWSDMQRELGDRPSGDDRLDFKHEWVKRNFPGENIANDCWLCEYASSKDGRCSGDPYCQYCPISWPKCHCNTLDFSYLTEPISEILALPAKNPSLDSVEVDSGYHKFREAQLGNYSGLPASATIMDHVAKLKEKAVEEYFAKTPGAKLATMDVDQAFKQYADEQKAPIFRALAEASGLSSSNESVKAHISLIRDTAKQNGRTEKCKEICKEIFDELSESSGLSKGNWCLSDHVKAIQEKAKAPMEPLRSANMLLVDTLNRYKDTLSKASDLDRNRPVDDHIREIVKNAMELGAAEERDRIQEKIYEVLLS